MFVEGLGTVDDQRLELGVQFFEDGFAESGADVADRFVGFGAWVEACEEEGSVDGGSFAFAVIGAEDDEVKGVAYAGEVIFFDLRNMSERMKKMEDIIYLQPVATPFTGLVTTFRAIKHFDHETLTGGFDTLV